MENIYLQIIQVWLYLREIQTTYAESAKMATAETICEWLGIDLGKLSEEDKLNLIDEVSDTLSVKSLIRMQELAGEKREEKLEDAKQQVIARMRDEFEQLGLSFEEVMGGRRGRRVRGSTRPPRYMSPAGQGWSGMGSPPKWLRDLEEAGHNREEYRIQNGG